MRKEYVKPAAHVEELIIGSMLATSGGGEHVEITPGQGGGADANEHRGSWEDLWN